MSGQIFPLLLICIVVLLVAVGVSRRAERGATRKTCVSNAADAGSLAAASGQAAAFNTLVSKNLASKILYDDYLRYYTILHELAQTYLAEGIEYSQKAENSAKAALDYINTPGDAACLEQKHQEDGANKNRLAAGSALKASRCFGAFAILAEYMRVYTDTYKANQAADYCGDRDFMDNSYTESKSDGFSYAFSNSCTESRFWESKQGVDFNWWLKTGDYLKAPSYTGEGAKSETAYHWHGSSKECGESTYGTTVHLELPKIEAYKLKHTLWPYPMKRKLSFNGNFSRSAISDVICDDGKADPFKVCAAKLLRDIMRDISNAFIGNATKGDEISALKKECCDCKPTEDNPCDCNSPADAEKLLLDQKRINNGLYALNVSPNTTAITGALSGAILKNIEKEIFENVWEKQDPDNFLSKTCEDVKPRVKLEDPAAQEPEYSEQAKNENGLMIINMEDEPEFSGGLNPWEVKCTVKSYSENIFDEYWNKCICLDRKDCTTESSSTSEFHGKGHLKIIKDDPGDNYEARILNITLPK